MAEKETTPARTVVTFRGFDNNGGWREIGAISLRADGSLKSSFDSNTLRDNILSSPCHLPGGEMVTSEDEPERWLSLLYGQFKSPYLQATRLGGNGGTTENKGPPNAGNGEGEGSCEIGQTARQTGCVPDSGSGRGGNVKGVKGNVGGPEQEHAAQVSVEIASALGGKTEKELSVPGQQADKKPWDVKVRKADGSGDHDIEVKSLLVRKDNAISIHNDALLRKVIHQKSNKENTFHTVVQDERNHYGGGEHEGKYSGHKLYYQRGSANGLSLNKMHPVKDHEELKKLLEMPYRDLPPKAKGKLPSTREDVRALVERAAKDAEARRAKDKAHKENNKEKLKEQARARYELKKAEKEKERGGEA